ncbi:hypothetical protein TNIN_370001 [Trichonephila inaurata madagascariensis]|uniref:Uncharacterized protein n=1 Tax=Trichonephila inaurata madagascariensis TaxID=2747483 RepID=A0A8X6X949_9ARAC|nr:hypothetical protein TNIN_370001 [Trichonephila inaurata madagascariensis]
MILSKSLAASPQMSNPSSGSTYSEEDRPPDSIIHPLLFSLRADYTRTRPDFIETEHVRTGPDDESRTLAEDFEIKDNYPTLAGPML